MPKIVLLASVVFVLIASCKKQSGDSGAKNTQLYPLTKGNKWIYVDSFFTPSGFFYGLDTFTLKAAQTILFNNEIYTPVTDQYDDSIFTLRSTDSSVYILKEQGEALMFKQPLDETLPVLINSYYGDLLNSANHTKLNTTSFPSYKIVITQDDGLWNHYKQQELFFTVTLGIIRGRDIRKTNAGNSYTYDSYKLITYGLK
jgi:hypothetical protein